MNTNLNPHNSTRGRSRRLLILMNKLDTIAQPASADVSRLSSFTQNEKYQLLSSNSPVDVLPDFSEAFASSIESVILIGKRSTSIHQQNSKEVSFSSALNNVSANSYARLDAVNQHHNPQNTSKLQTVDFCKAFQTSDESSQYSKMSSSSRPHEGPQELNFERGSTTLDSSTGNFVRPAGVSTRRKLHKDSRSSAICLSKISHIGDGSHLGFKQLESNQSAYYPEESSSSHQNGVIVKSSSSSSDSSRRCSTPIQGVSQRTHEDDLDLSYILPYEPLVKEPTASSSIPLLQRECSINLPKLSTSYGVNTIRLSHSSFRPTTSDASATNKHPSPSATHKVIPMLNSSTVNSNSCDVSGRKNSIMFVKDHRDDESIQSSTSNTISFVTKTFHTEANSPVKSPPKQPRMKKRINIDCKGLPRHPKFPKFDGFCTKRFYRYLLTKTEHKYGVRTNKIVVKLAEHVCDMVNQVMISSENGRALIHDIKMLLFRKKVVSTHFEFFDFCQKFLPAQFVWKAVPMMRPVSMPVIEFNWDTICDAIE